MATSPKAFLIELYEEYLEEASFLYEQRRTLFHNPEITWKKIGDFEERLEGHIDGLVVGDQLAIEVCKRRVAQGDFGELFAATSVFCRQDKRELVLSLLDELDPGDAEKSCALADALKYELPKAWLPDLLLLLDRGDPKLAPVLARALGYQRIECGPQLLNAMKRCAASTLPDIAWALGRIRYEPAKHSLLDHLTSEEEAVRSVTSVALARMGEQRAIDYWLEQAASQSWAIPPLGIAGGRTALTLLTELATKPGRKDCLTALGLLGDPVNIPLFISCLEDPKAADAAATSLQAITGAAPKESVFIPDEVDEDELFESEREQLKEGKPPTRGDGKPFGSTVTRLSQNPNDWNSWWKENCSRFTPGVPHCNGGPLSSTRLIEMLGAASTPHLLRQYLADELVTRYDHDSGFETDSPVIRQISTLADAAAWSISSRSRFQDGLWYFAGHRQH